MVKSDKTYVNEKSLVNDMINDMDYYYINQLLEHYNIDEAKLSKLCSENPELRIAIEKRYPGYEIKEVKVVEQPKPSKPEPKKLNIEIKEEK